MWRSLGLAAVVVGQQPQRRGSSLADIGLVVLKQVDEGKLGLNTLQA